MCFHARWTHTGCKFVTWHPTEALLLSCGYDDSIKIWKEDDEEFFCCQTLDDHADTVWGLTMERRLEADAWSALVLMVVSSCGSVMGRMDKANGV